MTTKSSIILIVSGMVISIPITWLLVNQVGKLVAPFKKAYLYLILLVLPAWESRKFLVGSRQAFEETFFYFWILYTIAMLILFVFEYQRASKKTDGKGQGL
ncbi:MAG: hypothetical protein ACOY90_07930 [Candidatus Zhuqueibacterota bacterium]